MVTGSRTSGWAVIARVSFLPVPGPQVGVLAVQLVHDDGRLDPGRVPGLHCSAFPAAAAVIRLALAFGLLLLLLSERHVRVHGLIAARALLVLDHGVQAVTLFHLIGQTSACVRIVWPMLGPMIMVTRVPLTVIPMSGRRRQLAGEQLVQAGCCSERQLASRRGMQVTPGTGGVAARLLLLLLVQVL